MDSRLRGNDTKGRAKLLVLRAPHALEETVHFFAQKGYDVFGESLFMLVPTAAKRPQVSAPPWVMITSRAALINLRPSDIADLLDRPCFCIGSKTAGAARALGFRNVTAGEGGGKELAEKIASGKGRAPILHLGAKYADPKVAEALERLGFEVFPWPVYEAVAVRDFSPALRRTLENGEISTALFFSVRTGQTFLRYVGRAGLEASCKRIKAVALSRAVAEAIEAAPWREVVWARAPSLEEMLKVCRS